MDISSLQAFSEIVLPPGSTSTELQAAIDTAVSGDTIVISGDMPFTGTVTIPTGKEIAIQSDVGNNWVMSSPGTMIRHFMVRGSLVLQNIILDGENIGGGVNPQQNSSFTMNSGSVIQNCFTTNSGGGVYVFFSTFTMNSGSVIQDCSVSFPTNDVDGGGVFLTNSTFAMNSGSTIQNCVANGSGGGVSASGTGIYNMTGGTISGNRAGRHGGGVATANNVTLNMDGVTISGNTASLRGGGVYVLARSSLNITGESHIVNNSAQDGGGIYTMDANYANLSTGADTVFNCNRASAAYAPPPDAGTLYPNIQFASTTITEHPLNNYDVNYTQEGPIAVNFHVTYDATGGSGSHTGPEVEPYGTDIVLSAEDTGISRGGYAFTSWNTEPDGSGTSYSPGDYIILRCNVTLYAQWVAAEGYNVTYGANGGSGGFVDPGRQYGSVYMILSTNQAGISRPGFTFTGWNTKPDGSGISFAPGDIVTITGDVMLYAQWRQNPTPKRRCRAPVTKCRISIEGQKIWVGDGDAGDKRPASVEIILLRDGEIYRRADVDSAGDGVFAFCCLPKWKNSGQEYNYQIDETTVTAGYTKKIEGYNVINTFTP